MSNFNHTGAFVSNLSPMPALTTKIRVYRPGSVRSVRDRVSFSIESSIASLSSGLWNVYERLNFPTYEWTVFCYGLLHDTLRFQNNLDYNLLLRESRFLPELRPSVCIAMFFRAPVSRKAFSRKFSGASNYSVVLAICALRSVLYLFLSF